MAGQWCSSFWLAARMTAPGSGPERQEERFGNGSLRGHGLLAKLSWALRSEAGNVRPNNEDFAGVYAPTTPDDSWDRGPLFVVCDGLGGHAAGEVASRAAVETALTKWSAPDPPAPPVALRAAVNAANTAVFDAALQRRDHGMATTFTALTLAGREAVIAHIGDSRCYLVRRGACTQLTSDHSKVGEMRRRGLLSPERADAHPDRSQLLRAVGLAPVVQIDVVKAGTEAGDIFLLCSDGLWDVVNGGGIAEVVGSVGTPGMPTVVDAAERLIDSALRAGTADNVTVLVVKVVTDRAVPAAGARRSFFRRDRRWRAFDPTR